MTMAATGERPINKVLLDRQMYRLAEAIGSLNPGDPKRAKLVARMARLSQLRASLNPRPKKDA